MEKNQRYDTYNVLIISKFTLKLNLTRHISY
jgi:hypothetical protein